MEKNNENYFFFLDNVDKLSLSDASFFPWIDNLLDENPHARILTTMYLPKPSKHACMFIVEGF